MSLDVSLNLHGTLLAQHLSYSPVLRCKSLLSRLLPSCEPPDCLLQAIGKHGPQRRRSDFDNVLKHDRAGGEEQAHWSTSARR